MAFYIKNYTIVVDKDYSATTSIFRDNLDDMSKKGYSLSGNTVIYNSDHKSKYFSGEYKNNRFVVRQTDSGTDDFYYRILPKHEISFESLNGKTKINVKSKNTIALVFFFVFLVITLFVFSVSYFFAFFCGANKLFMLFTFVPIILLFIISALSRHSINDTKITLEYIYNIK